VDPTPSRRELDLEWWGEVAVVRLAGRGVWREEEVLAVGDQLCALVERQGCRRLVVSLAGVARAGTALVGKLLALHKQEEAVGGRLALCHLDPQLRHALGAAGLARLFHLYATEQEAVLSF
jgi:anti-anti-sigma factor